MAVGVAEVGGVALGRWVPAAARPLGDEVALAGDLEGQVGGEIG